jgi:hypothetical protein
LFEDDVVALVKYLVEGELVVTSESGRFVNGPAAEWEETPRLLAELQRLRRRKRQASAA